MVLARIIGCINRAEMTLKRRRRREVSKRTPCRSVAANQIGHSGSEISTLAVVPSHMFTPRQRVRNCLTIMQGVKVAEACRLANLSPIR